MYCVLMCGCACVLCTAVWRVCVCVCVTTLLTRSTCSTCSTCLQAVGVTHEQTVHTSQVTKCVEHLLKCVGFRRAKRDDWVWLTTHPDNPQSLFRYASTRKLRDEALSELERGAASPASPAYPASATLQSRQSSSSIVPPNSVGPIDVACWLSLPVPATPAPATPQAVAVVVISTVVALALTSVPVNRVQALLPASLVSPFGRIERDGSADLHVLMINICVLCCMYRVVEWCVVYMFCFGTLINLFLTVVTYL